MISATFLRHRHLFLLFGLVVVLLIAAGVAFLPGMRRETTLEFQVRDTVSGVWVWDMEARIQDRVINGFFQSDQGLKTYRFTGLEPGSAVLAISAPAYIPVEIPVELGRGVNTFTSPVSLLGYGIPGLSNFLAFERAHTNGWEISLRPVSAENRAILFHPALDIWVGVRVTSWDSGLAPTVENLDARPTLYEGSLRWRWDSTPETQFRYLVDLPFSHLVPFDGPSVSIEYLILVPDPRTGTSVDLGAIAVQLFDLEREQINAFLDTPTVGFAAFTDVSWNIRR